MLFRSDGASRKQVLGSLLVLHALCLAACCSVESVRTESLLDGVVGQPYSFHFEDNCAGETAFPGKWQVTENLPPGMMLSEFGQFSGTPTLPGSFSFVVTLSTFGGPNPETVLDSKTFALVVRPAP